MVSLERRGENRQATQPERSRAVVGANPGCSRLSGGSLVTCRALQNRVTKPLERRLAVTAPHIYVMHHTGSTDDQDFEDIVQLGRMSPLSMENLQRAAHDGPQSEKTPRRRRDFFCST